MVFFNDPVRCEDGALRAIRMAAAMRTRVRSLAEAWARQGHDLALGIGISQGYATLGRIGFDGRHDYAAIGSVTNLAARLCADAEPWQVLVTERVLASAGSRVRRRPRRPGAARLQPSGPHVQRAGARQHPGDVVTGMLAAASRPRLSVRAGR
jgi:class 3 adenylate cyclase